MKSSCPVVKLISSIYRCHENYFLVFVLNSQISRNVQQIPITAMLTLTVPIPKDPSTAHVTRDILEMVSLVLVKELFL